MHFISALWISRRPDPDAAGSFGLELIRITIREAQNVILLSNSRKFKPTLYRILLMWIWKLHSKWTQGPGIRFWQNPPRTKSRIILIYPRFSAIYYISKRVGLGAWKKTPRKSSYLESTFCEKNSRDAIWSFRPNPPRTKSRIILIYPRFSAIYDISKRVDLGAWKKTPRKIPTLTRFLSQSVGRQSAPDSVLETCKNIM